MGNASWAEEMESDRGWMRLEVEVAVYSNFLFATLARPWAEKGKAVDQLGISASATTGSGSAKQSSRVAPTGLSRCCATRGTYCTECWTCTNYSYGNAERGLRQE
jgi:hypothetical protein